MKEKDLLPEHYELKEMPYYSGDGNLNVLQLESLCKDFSEYTHQQALIKEKLMRAIKTCYALTTKTGKPELEFISNILKQVVS